MKCGNCGVENSSSAKFCKNCGNRLTEMKKIQPGETETLFVRAGGKRHISRGEISLFVLALLAVTVIVGSICYAGAKYNSGQKMMKVGVIYSEELDCTYVFSEDNNLLIQRLAGAEWVDQITLDGKGSRLGLIYGLEGKCVLLLMENGDLYRVEDSRQKVAAEVCAAKLSANEQAILFIDNKDDLYYYAIKTGRTEIIADDVSETAVISPDGKTVVYERKEDSETVLYLWKDNQIKELGENLEPISVSNDGECIYALGEQNGALYVIISGKDKIEVASGVEDTTWIQPFLMNRDMTELIFATDEGTFITVRGQDKIKIDDSFADFLLLPNSEVRYAGSFLKAIHYNIKTFQNLCLYSAWEDRAIFLDESYAARTTVEIGTLPWFFAMDPLENNFYYLDSEGSICKLDIKSESKEILAKSVKHFAITPDYKCIYYIDEEERLYYMNIANTEDRERVADDVSWVLTTGSGCIFFGADYNADHTEGSIYKVEGKAKKEKLADHADIILYSQWNYRGPTCYNVKNSDGTYSLYVSDGGTDIFRIMMYDMPEPYY